MGIVSFSRSPILSALLGPVQVMATWFIPKQRVSRELPVPVLAQQIHHQLVLPLGVGCATKAEKVASKKPGCSRLKVVRDFDSAVSPAFAGRMVISGRMADVCAELERLTQCETTAH
jgi:hypothetical protein